jgi:Phosphorylated CTD interacting factor 1 WW domain
MNRSLVAHIRDILQFRDTLCLISHVNNEGEIMKIWARWIITHRSLFPQKSICLPTDREYDPQLIVELIEKGVSNLHANYIHKWMESETERINSKFPWSTADTEFGGIHGNEPITSCVNYGNKTITLSCGGIDTSVPLDIFAKLSMKIKQLPESAFSPLNYIWYTNVLYTLLDGKGLQWAVPPNVMNLLRTRLRCNTELFASPFNNYFTNYYSLYPLDVTFGSKGNFFTAPDKDFLTGSFQVNPPFIDCLFNKTTERILRLLKIADENGRDLTFIYIMPQWENFATFDMVMQSQFCVRHINLKAHAHFYYQYITHTYIRARFGTSIVFLSTSNTCCDTCTESDIINAFSTTYKKNY